MVNIKLYLLTDFCEVFTIYPDWKSKHIETSMRSILCRGHLNIDEIIFVINY